MSEIQLEEFFEQVMLDLLEELTSIGIDRSKAVEMIFDMFDPNEMYEIRLD
jgi:hypothetical protein